MGGPTSGTSRKRKTLPRSVRPGWLRSMDQRSRIARSLHERLISLATDLGGIDTLSGMQRSLLERFIHCEALIAQHEERARQGEPVDLAQHLALVDRLVRMARTLGLERRAKPVRRLADVIAETPP